LNNVILNNTIYKNNRFIKILILKLKGGEIIINARRQRKCYSRRIASAKRSSPKTC